jgi:hypothetical protein
LPSTKVETKSSDPRGTHLIGRYQRHLLQRTRQNTLWVEPRPLTLGRVENEAKTRTIRLENTPHFQEQLRRANNTAIVHVPLLIGGVQNGNAINNRLKATAEVKRAKRVAFTRGLKHLGVIVNEKRLRVAPSSPPLQTWKHVRLQQMHCDPSN